MHLNFYYPAADATYEVVIRLQKKNIPHTESPDCPTTMFHEITGLSYDDEDGYIDSIVIANSSVNYGSQENLKIYLHYDD